MRKIILTGWVLLALSACSKKDNTPSIPAPGKSTLSAPAQNSLCTTGSVITDGLSLITFNWAASDNTDGYEIDVKNLITGATISQLSTTTQVQIILARNTPFSWSVISRSSNSSSFTQSDTWKFYNSGVGITSYAPFPATIVSPTYGQNIAAGTTTINLTWTGSDVDNDIAGYDIYFGTTTNPPLLKNGITDTFLNGQTVSTGNYYWKVITKDSQGNISTTDVYQFKVN